MALLPILRFPDPRLHTAAKPVRQIDARIRQIVADMAETMYDAPGIGLAATQVDIHEQIIVIDISKEKNQLLVLINPQIVVRSEVCKIYEEGCLSVPGVYDEVERPDRIQVQALNLDGQIFTLETDGLLAVCLQHEIDHLQGKVFVQHLSRLKQNRIRAKLVKQAEPA